jgi:hypothetical protein
MLTSYADRQEVEMAKQRYAMKVLDGDRQGGSLWERFGRESVPR